MAKLTLKVLEARIIALETELSELKKNKSARKSNAKSDDVPFTKVIGPIATTYRPEPLHKGLWRALNYRLKESVGTYTYDFNGKTMNVSPEQAALFESTVVDFFSGDEEKGYAARKVTFTEVTEHPKV